MTPARWLLVGLVACTGGEAANHASAKGPQADATQTAPAAAAPACGLPDVVAEINGEKITSDQFFDLAGAELVQAEVALAEARKQALDGMIMQRLVEAEAKKQGMEVEAFVAKEVEAAKKPVSAEEVQKFYQDNVAQMQGMPLEMVKPQIEKFLAEKQTGEALRALVTRLEEQNQVKKHLEPYRVQVDTAGSARMGSPEAPVQIVEFSDFQCPYCTMAADTVKKVQERYGDKVSLVYRHFPLEFHGSAQRAAEASECANDQGQFWKFHDALFADQKAWTDEDYKKYAKDIGLDGKKFQKCLEAGTHAAKVEEDIAEGKKAGMSGTPGFYVNGVVLSGAQPVEAFVEVIDAELARRAK